MRTGEHFLRVGEIEASFGEGAVALRSREVIFKLLFVTPNNHDA